MQASTTRRGVLRATAGAVAVGLAGCLGSDPTTRDVSDGALAATSAEQLSAPGCACCHEYATYLRPHLDGALVETKTDDLASAKGDYGVPRSL